MANLNINDDVFKRIADYAKKENVSVDTLLYNLINDKPNEFPLRDINFQSNNINEILLEQTGIFNYKGNQSSVYNRLKNNNIKTVKELFDFYDGGKIDYGKNSMNDNYYIHSEIKGAIELLKYKYLNEIPQSFESLLTFKINTDFIVYISQYYQNGFPGVITKSIHSNLNDKKLRKYVDVLYETLKSLGFNHMCTKFIIDYAFKINEKTEKVFYKNGKSFINFSDKDLKSDITIGELLKSMNLKEIKSDFTRIPNEYPVFVNIVNILVDYYNKYILEENVDIKKY